MLFLSRSQYLEFEQSKRRWGTGYSFKGREVVCVIPDHFRLSREKGTRERRGEGTLFDS